MTSATDEIIATRKYVEDAINTAGVHKYIDDAINKVRAEIDAHYLKRDEKLFPDMGDHYQKLPNGLIFQWGIVNQAGFGTEIRYPIPFPNQVFGVFTNGAEGLIRQQETFNVVLKDKSSFQVFVCWPGGRNSSNCCWFALGC